MSDKKLDVLDMPIKGSKCPNCGKEAVRRFSPFCSERCKNVDLGRWFGGSYSIKGRDGEAINEIIDEKGLDI